MNKWREQVRLYEKTWVWCLNEIGFSNPRDLGGNGFLIFPTCYVLNDGVADNHIKLAILDGKAPCVTNLPGNTSGQWLPGGMKVHDRDFWEFMSGLDRQLPELNFPSHIEHPSLGCDAAHLVEPCDSSAAEIPKPGRIDALENRRDVCVTKTVVHNRLAQFPRSYSSLNLGGRGGRLGPSCS